MQSFPFDSEISRFVKSVARSVFCLGISVVASLTMCLQADAAQADLPLSSTTFDSVFGADGEPERMHYTANFLSRGDMHKMEVWREGQTRLRRNTDNALETYVIRDAGTAEFQMTILDKLRKIATSVDSASLHRGGNYISWYDLAHDIKRPEAAYDLAKGRMPMMVPVPASECTWYDLTQAGYTMHICWDAKSRLPMLLVGEKSELYWQIIAWDDKPIEASVFDIDDAGYVRNNSK